MHHLPTSVALWSPGEVAHFLHGRGYPDAAETVHRSVSLYSFDEIDGSVPGSYPPSLLLHWQLPSLTAAPGRDCCKTVLRGYGSSDSTRFVTIQRSTRWLTGVQSAAEAVAAELSTLDGTAERIAIVARAAGGAFARSQAMAVLWGLFIADAL